MSIFKSLFSRSKNQPQEIEKKSTCGVSTGGQQQVILQDGDFLNYAMGVGLNLPGYEYLPDELAFKFYRTSSAVSTAVDIITQEMGRISPVLKTSDGKLDDSHPVLEKLKNPNDWNEDWNFFFSSLGKAYLITGNSYAYAAGPISRPPLELYSLKPQNVNDIGGDTDYRPKSFTVYVGDGRGTFNRKRERTGFRFYDGNLKELWQTMMYSSTSDNMKGCSPLKSICLDINSQIKGRIHNVKLLDNGGRPSMLVTFTDTMDATQHSERRELINEQLAGTDNVGKIAVISASDMDINELGINNKDMDYSNLEKMTEQAIYKRYRIPLPLVSNDASTDNNMAHAVYQLYDFAVLPRTDELLSSLSMFLLPRYGLDPSEYQLTYNPDQIEALKQRRIDTLIKRKDLNIETINELREDMPNREPVDGGNDILVQSTLIPIASVDIMQQESEATTPEEEAQALAERDGADV